MDLNELTQGEEITPKIIKKVFAKHITKHGEEYRYSDEFTDIIITETDGEMYLVKVETVEIFNDLQQCKVATTNQLRAFLTIAGRRDIAEKIL